jgi:hypothetical protein
MGAYYASAGHTVVVVGGAEAFGIPAGDGIGEDLPAVEELLLRSVVHRDARIREALLHGPALFALRRSRPGDHQTDGGCDLAGQNDALSSHSFVHCGLPPAPIYGMSLVFVSSAIRPAT